MFNRLYVRPKFCWIEKLAKLWCFIFVPDIAMCRQIDNGLDVSSTNSIAGSDKSLIFKGGRGNPIRLGFPLPPLNPPSLSRLPKGFPLWNPQHSFYYAKLVYCGSHVFCFRWTLFRFACGKPGRAVDRLYFVRPIFSARRLLRGNP